MTTVIVMFFVSMLASITGSLIGGTSLITIPTLIMLGVPAHTAIGTDRFAIFGGVLVGRRRPGLSWSKPAPSCWTAP